MNTRRSLFAVGMTLLASTALAADRSPGPMIQALWLVHREGNAPSVVPAADAKLKAALAKAFAKDGALTSTNSGLLFPTEVFTRLAGADARLTALEIAAIMSTDGPESRDRLFPTTRTYVEGLSTSFDRIDATHQKAIDEFVDWIVANYESGKPLPVICICTANSRRSFLGQSMGNVAAAYYGLPEVRFFSGGTELSALNPRTIRALTAVGIEVEPTGEHAPAGNPKTPNPTYTIRWGTTGTLAFETREFSKVYNNPINPPKGFAALMVCSDADESCPLVKGASARISIPFHDPKVYDDSAFEVAKYDERRDDIGREMMAALMQARRRLVDAGKTRN